MANTIVLVVLQNAGVIAGSSLTTNCDSSLE